MNRRKAIIVGILLLIIIATFSIIILLKDDRVTKEWENFDRFVLKQEGSEEVLKNCKMSSYIWQQNAGQMYRIKIYNGMILEGQDKSKELVDLDGTLNFRILRNNQNSSQDDDVYIAMQLSDLTVTMGGKRSKELENLFQTYFIVTVSKFGNIAGFNFSPHLNQKDLASLKEMVNSLQFLIPPEIRNDKENESFWETEEKNSLGTYHCKYFYNSADCLFSKSKLEYLEININQFSSRPQPKENNIKAKIVNSKIICQITPSVSWLTRLKGCERTRLFQGNRIISDIESKLYLELIPFDPNENLIIWRKDLYNLESALKALLTQKFNKDGESTWESVTQKRLQEKYESIDITDTLRQFNIDITEEVPHSKVLNAIKNLSQHLKAFPERALLLPEALKGMKESSVRPVFSALETAGDSNAQEALARVMSDNDQSDYNRLHSIISSSGISKPNEELVDNLMDLVNKKSAGTAEDIERSNTALLALGALGKNSRSENEDLAEIIENKINDQLEDAQSAEEKTVAIKALSNLDTLKSEEDFDKISVYLNDDSIEVQRAAIETLKNSPGEYKIEKTMTLFLSSNESRIRITAFNTLKTVQEVELIHKVIKAGLTRLNVETNPYLKKLIITYLGENRARDKKIVPALKMHLRNEKTRDIARVILRAIFE